ncbi:MAG: 3-isopropylmalate dehydratase large subunit [candidate division Zixibacteria bacterium RBG_16_48_11]|nr:MAG: 3-isopropylmalate dehydratase large subunit [candidate division Zixibacteria bacterium RBG_16_48_11]
MGQTLSERIISEHVNRKVTAGETVLTPVDLCLLQDGTAPLAIRQLGKLGLEKVFNPKRVVFFIDHASPSPRRELSNDHTLIKEFAKKTGAQLSDIGGGISHQVINEFYVNPGDILIGADSHTCTGGALCAFATGLGSSDVAIGMALGKTWFRVPETFKIVIKGKFPFGVFAKDLILHLIGLIGADGATYKALEFCGETIENLPMHDRLTLSNMAVEAGAKVGLIASDKITQKFLQRMGRGNKYRKIKPDSDAVYDRVIEMDVSQLEPQISFPHTVDNTCPLSKAKGIRIQQVFLGTCTNGRLEDLAIFYSIVKGRKRDPQTRVIINPASRTIYLQAIERGYLEEFVRFGAEVLMPGCGPCVGVHGGIPSDGENILSTMNRNFKGRMGNPESFIYLASPAVCAATALKGEIADPREFLPKPKKAIKAKKPVSLKGPSPKSKAKSKTSKRKKK